MNKEKQHKALKDWLDKEHTSAVPGVVNTCWICGRKFVAPGEMVNPVCPECESSRTEMRVPEKRTPKHNDSSLSCLEAQLYAQSLENPYGDLPPTQQKIHEIMGAMKDLLLYKNQKYGDSAINPKGIFYKGDSTNSILIRLDDKIGRVMSNTEEKPRVNDVCDIIGYCTLLLISMGVTSEDIAKFKD